MHFDMGWVEAFPAQQSIEAGTDVAVLIRRLGFWSLNGARVLYGVGGNVTVQIGDEGVLVVGTQYAGMSTKLLAAIRSLSSTLARRIRTTPRTGSPRPPGAMGPSHSAIRRYAARVCAAGSMRLASSLTAPRMTQ